MEAFKMNIYKLTYGVGITESHSNLYVGTIKKDCKTYYECNMGTSDSVKRVKKDKIGEIESIADGLVAVYLLDDTNLNKYLEQMRNYIDTYISIILTKYNEMNTKNKGVLPIIDIKN